MLKNHLAPVAIEKIKCYLAKCLHFIDLIKKKIPLMFIAFTNNSHGIQIEQSDGKPVPFLFHVVVSKVYIY